MTRRRRASLTGWWWYLPFVAVPFGLLFSEVWYQTQILNNEYRKNALRSTIRQADQTLAALDDEIRELARMERVLEHAADLGLGPPNPGQVVEVRMAGAAESEPEAPVVLVTPLLAGPPKVAQPIAVAKAAPPASRSLTIDLTEWELLEPAGDWVE